MTKAKISEYSATAGDNTDVNGVNIAEGCPPSSMNNMGREIMAALKRFQTGSDSDGVTVGGNLVVSGTSTLSTTSISSADINAGTIDGTAIGGSTAAAGSFTTLNTSGQVVFNDAGADVDFRVEGDTDANLLFVDASTDRVGIGTNAPSATLDIEGLGNTVAAHIFTSDNVEGATASIVFGTTPGARSKASVQMINTNTGNSSGALAFSTNSAGTLSERMRITSDGFLRMSSNSGGIQFNGDTAAANALDDYEEGTWTPSITGWTGAYGAQVGRYTKVGRLVTVFGQARTTAGTGTFSDSFPGISSLPFTGPNTGESQALGMWFCTGGTTGLTSSQTASGPMGGPSAGTSAFPNWIVTGGNVANWDSSKLDASATVEYRFFITYSTT